MRTRLLHRRGPRGPVRPARRGAALLGLGATALVTGCGSGGDDLPAVEAATSPRLEVTATEMGYEPREIAVAAGTVDVVLHNEGAMLHDLRIGGVPFILEAGAGEVATTTVTLEPGRYELFCSLPGHREAGMEAVLEVR